MIIVDEFHHAAAPSYQKLLSYFKPRILLGLTATPERMDGKDILSYFDGHMAAEIRLSEAIERRLLVPFHYFGVEDPIDLSHVAWSKGQYETDELIHLYARDHTAEIRANAILRALTRYTSDLRDVKGIGFALESSMPNSWPVSSPRRGFLPLPYRGIHLMKCAGKQQLT